MARTFLDQNENEYRVSNSNDTLLGQAGGDPGEGILIQDGVTGIETDANIERVDSPLALGAHTFQVTDNGLEISANGETIVTIPSLNQTLELRTADGSIDIGQSGAQEFTATNPTDPNDTATIDTTAGTPDIGVDPSEISATAPAQNTVSVADNGPVAEGGTASFTVNLSQAADTEVSVDYAIGLVGGASADDHGQPTIDGNDANLTGTLTFAAGETSQSIDIPVKDDAIDDEDGEGISVSLSNLQGPEDVSLGTASTTAAITDVPLSFTLSQVGDDPREGQTVTYEVVASAPVDNDTDVAFEVVPGDADASDQGTNSTNLNDFQQGAFNPSTTTIAAGDTTTTFTVSTQNEGLTELPEDFIVEATIAGNTQSVTTTLLDGGEEGRLFSLTSGADTFQPNASNEANRPTAGPDTFRGTDDGDFTGADVIQAADGRDDVDAVLAPDGTDDNIAPSLTSVERVVLDASDANTTQGDTVVFDGSNSTGVETIRFDNFGDGDGTNAGTDLDTVKAENIGTDVDVGFKGANDTGGGSAAIVDFDGVSADSDSAAINLYDAAIGDGAPNADGLTVNNIETLTLNAEGASGSTIDDLDAGSATTLNIGGSQNLTISNALAPNAGDIDTINASSTFDITTGALGQDLSVNGSDGDDTLNAGNLGSNDLTARLGAGDDSVTLDSGDDTISGGAGDDAIDLNGGLGAADSIDGGNGSDIIVDGGSEISSYETSDDKLAALTDIEGIGLQGASSNLGNNSVDLSRFGEAGERFVITASGAISVDTTVRGLSSTSTVETETKAMMGSNRLNLRVPGAQAADARDDSVTFRHATDANVSGFGVANLDLAGINTLNVESNDSNPSANDGLNLMLNNEETINTIDVSGEGVFKLDASNARNLDSLQTVDAADADGSLRLDLGNNKFDGHEGVRVIGGAADDTIQGTDFTDVVTTGDGADTVVYDDKAFGASDRVTDFASGTDRLLIDLRITDTDGVAATVSNAKVENTDGANGNTVGAAAGNQTLKVLNTASAIVSVNTAGVGFLNMGLTGNTQPLTNANQVFTASNSNALVSAVTGAAAGAASNVDSAGAVAFGFSTGSSKLFLFRFTDTSNTGANGAADLTTVTNTIATIGNGTVAFDDIAIF